MNLNLVYDSSVNSAPAGFTNSLNALASFFQSAFQDPVTINIQVGYGEIGGQALDAGALGESSAFFNIFSYDQVRSALISDAKSPDDATAVASLPATAPVDGTIWVTRAEAKAVGLTNAASTRVDGYIGFNGTANIFDYDNSNGVSRGQYDFFAVAAHEISEIMGRQMMDGGSSGGTNTPMDLFHYAGFQNRIFVGDQAGYFSPDNGATDLGDFNTIPSGDTGDWASTVGRDAFRAFSSSGVVNAISQNDIRVMDVLGWDLAGGTTTNSNTAPLVALESSGNTTLALSGNQYYLLQNGSGPSLKFSGQDVVGGQFGDWTPIGAEKTASGYEIAWKSVGSNLYSLWNTDPNGNYTANVVGAVSGSDPAIVSAESLFQQDLNGDGHVGAGMASIETSGNTELAVSANRFYLLQNGSGPSLKFSGQDVVGGQFGDWTPLGAEKTASGYEIAWKSLGSNLYSLWNTDVNGNYLGNIGGAVSGSDPTLLSVEALFQQDLNGDGQVSPAMVPIETSGSTTLAMSANHFYLLQNGNGPSLKFSGQDVVAGQFGDWTPIGAEKTGSGYEIAWKSLGANLYSLWNTDSNGNYIANIGGAVSGTDPALVSAESLFHQDLNGDGHWL
jgi:serralysin